MSWACCLCKGPGRLTNSCQYEAVPIDDVSVRIYHNKSPDHEIVGKTKAIAIALKGESRRRRRRRVLICVAYHLLPERESHHSVIK